MSLIKSILTGYLFLISLTVFSQENVKLLSNWDYRRKATAVEKIHKVISTSHGYVVAVGETGGDRLNDTDGLFIVVDAKDGQTEHWKKIGRDGNQGFTSVVQNPDGTFTLVGYDESKPGNRDGWIVDVDQEGELINRESVGGPAKRNDEIFDVAVNDQGITLMIGQQDMGKTNGQWFLRKMSDGSFAELKIPVALPGHARKIIALNDLSFAILGNSGNREKGQIDRTWVIKIDTTGRPVWKEIVYFGKAGLHEGIGISESPLDGSLVISGLSPGKGGQSDMWLLKMDPKGELIWDRTFGGDANDIGVDVVALSEGGYALLGHTWSHIPRVQNSAIQLLVIGEEGALLDESWYPIVEGRGNQLAASIAESTVGYDVIITGNSTPQRDQSSLPMISAVTYKSPIDLSLIKNEDNTYGNIAAGAVELANVTFFDANNNRYLESGERGFVSVDVTNSSLETMTNVMAQVSSNEKSDIRYWNQVHVGSLMAGQTKKLHIPVQAMADPRESSYQLNIQIQSQGINAASTQAKIASNRPDPANLIANKFNFSPELKADPGKPITILVDVMNIGGLSSQPVTATFNVPSGVISQNSEKVKIPALAPNEKYSISFVFHYLESFDQNNIKITLETENIPTMSPLRQSFSYALGTAKPVVEYVKTPTNEMDIIWTSHEAAEFRSVDVNQREVNIRTVAVANKEMSKRNFAVLINGRRAQGQKLDESRLTPPENKSEGRMEQWYSNVIQLGDGPNEIQVVYYDEEGKEILGKSKPMIFNYIPKDAPNLYVLSIGVEHEDLDFTVQDAKTFAAMYSKQHDEKGRTFRKVNVKPLITKEETTEKGIKKAFLDLAKNQSIKDNDLVVVFISSHGKVVDGNKYVLLPSDYDPQYEDLTTIDFNEDILKRLRGMDGNKLLFIDACHSGSAGARSFSDEAASKMMNDLINATSGMEIFASCADSEFSYEDPSWGNGAFTKAIMEAFNNETVEIDGAKVNADIFIEINGKKERGSDGVITIEELKEFVQKRVPYLVKSVKKKPQNPVNKSTDLLPKEMGIYLVNQ